jgi:hypothetical protein
MNPDIFLESLKKATKFFGKDSVPAEMRIGHFSKRRL